LGSRPLSFTTQVQWLVDYVRANGGIRYAYDLMRQFTDEALELLQRFSDSPARESLRNLVLYTISREK